MKHLTPSDLWPLPVYEGVRDAFRKEVIAAKAHRRVTVGPLMTFVFENRLTVKFQIQEILRAERITDPAVAAEEVRGFNEMLPGPGELSATLLIELSGPDAEVKARLATLTGLGKHLWLEVAGRRVPGELEGGRDDGTKVAAVQYLRFKPGALDPAQPLALVVDHPAYSHRLELAEGTRRELARDLEGP